MQIDYSLIQSGIRDIACKTFEGKAISTSLLKLYCEEVRSFLNDFIAERIEFTYRENLSKISSAKKGDFLNLEHGYIVSMTNWTNSNPIVFPVVDFIEETAAERNSKEQNMSLSEIANRESVRILGIGSFVNIILWISGLKILSIVAEAAVVGIGAYKMMNESQQSFGGTNTQRIAFESKANAFINRVNSVAEEYAHCAEAKSNELLSNYLKD